MAKVTSPLLSFAAAGSVGSVTFCHGAQPGQGTHYARKKPRGRTTPRSAGQQSNNTRFADGCAVWRAMPTIEKAWWLGHGDTPTKYGFAWFIAEYLDQRCPPATQPLRPVPRWVAP